MKFVDLVNRFKNDEKAVCDRLIELYPDMKDSREGYLDVMKELESLDPWEDCDMQLVVAEVEDWYDKSKYIDVSGSSEEDGDSYAIEYSPWEEWLAMEISDDTLENFSAIDIYAHSLWEMTWAGFDQSEIQGKIDSMNEAVNSIREQQEPKSSAEAV